MDRETSFVMGFNYGKRNGVELTPREIGTQFPDVDSDAFAQGNVDGVLGDRFRLSFIQKPFWTK